MTASHLIDRTPRDATGALIVWILAQTLVLVLITRETSIIPGLSRRDALAVLAACDAGLAGMLFPALVRTGWGCAEALATMLILLMLAGAACGAGWMRVASAGGYVAGWLAALRFWEWAFRGRRSSFGSAVGTLVVLGGALLAYLAVDFTAPGARQILEHSPIPAAWKSAGLHFPPLSAAATIAFIVTSGAVARSWLAPKAGENR
jgi:hypothetical protein